MASGPMLAKTDEVTYPTYRYARMGLGLKVAMALPSDGVAYNISRNNEYIQKISNRNGSIAHIAGNTYAHPFSTQQAIGTIHIDVYIYVIYTFASVHGPVPTTLYNVSRQNAL